MKKNTKALLDASKEADLEVNPEKNNFIIRQTKAQHKHSK
jgi:hypothetical protein